MRTGFVFEAGTVYTVVNRRPPAAEAALRRPNRSPPLTGAFTDRYA